MTLRKSSSTPDADSLYQVAVKALARRARSIGEMRALLGRKKAAKQDIEAVLRRLKENGYLDDARFARSFITSRLENDRVGPRRVRHDLAARRVHPELAQKAIRAAYEEVDERALLRDYLRRKVRLTKPPEKPSAVASLYRRLLRAGFASDTIVRELQGILRGAFRQGRSEIDPAKWQEWLDSLAEAPEPEADA